MVEPAPEPVAQYLRMSTDPQFLSLDMQRAANAAYAQGRGQRIVTTYEDPGLSGLTLENRPGLKGLLADVLSGRAQFSKVLVADVSRWGRFQDPDEAAHYEFLCRSAGVEVHYTAEPFRNDADLASVLVKQLKRMMAAEFLRDHSEKIRRVHQLLNEQGFFAGGRRPYGYVRLQVASDGTPQKLLGPGEKKSFVASRLVLTPGPPEEVAVVRQIFDDFVRRRRTTAQIAKDLNLRFAATARDHPWTTAGVCFVLRNTIYAGDLVSGKERYVLKARTRLPPSAWRRRPQAVQPTVSRATWNKAQDLLALGGHSHHVTDAQLLADLRRVYRNAGHLNLATIKAQGQYTVGLYTARFGSMTRAYLQAGLKPYTIRPARPRESYLRKPHAYSHEDILENVRAAYQREGRLTSRIINEDPACPRTPTLQTHFGGLRLVYALVGYQPTAYQELMMEARGQALTQAEAEAVRRRVQAGVPPEELL